jgi:hypothetical protein
MLIISFTKNDHTIAFQCLRINKVRLRWRTIGDESQASCGSQINAPTCRHITHESRELVVGSYVDGDVIIWLGSSNCSAICRCRTKCFKIRRKLDHGSVSPMPVLASIAKRT